MASQLLAKHGLGARTHAVDLEEPFYQINANRRNLLIVASFHVSNTSTATLARRYRLERGDYPIHPRVSDKSGGGWIDRKSVFLALARCASIAGLTIDQSRVLSARINARCSLIAVLLRSFSSVLFH